MKAYRALVDDVMQPTCIMSLMCCFEGKAFKQINGPCPAGAIIEWRIAHREKGTGKLGGGGITEHGFTVQRARVLARVDGRTVRPWANKDPRFGHLPLKRGNWYEILPE